MEISNFRFFRFDSKKDGKDATKKLAIYEKICYNINGKL